MLGSSRYGAGAAAHWSRLLDCRARCHLHWCSRRRSGAHHSCPHLSVRLRLSAGIDNALVNIILSLLGRRRQRVSGAELFEESYESMSALERSRALVFDCLEVSVGKPYHDVFPRCGTDMVVGGVVAARYWVPLDDEDAHLVRLSCQMKHAGLQVGAVVSRVDEQVSQRLVRCTRTCMVRSVHTPHLWHHPHPLLFAPLSRHELAEVDALCVDVRSAPIIGVSDGQAS